MTLGETGATNIAPQAQLSPNLATGNPFAVVVEDAEDICVNPCNEHEAASPNLATAFPLTYTLGEPSITDPP